jgi:hypothetical protein
LDDLVDDISVDEDVPVEPEDAAENRRKRKRMMRDIVEAMNVGGTNRFEQQAQELLQQQQQMLLQMLQLQGSAPQTLNPPLAGYQPNSMTLSAPASGVLDPNMRVTPIYAGTGPNGQPVIILTPSVQPQMSPQLLAMLQHNQKAKLPKEPPPPPTNRPTIPLALDGDADILSPFQCLLRQHIEVFETSQEMMQRGKQGRNSPVVLGQVGIQCRHCAKLPFFMQPAGTVYYSRTLEGVYQVCQNMAKSHFLNGKCSFIPSKDKAKLKQLQGSGTSGKSAGKGYWSRSLLSLGVYDDGHVLRFTPVAPKLSAPSKSEARQDEEKKKESKPLEEERSPPVDPDETGETKQLEDETVP